MARLGLERVVVDAEVYGNTVARFREAGILLPTLGQLADPSTIPAAIRARLASIDHHIEMTRVDRKRAFNLGYFTWVEQQGVSVEEFSARMQQSFWDRLQDLVPAWDAMIARFNGESGAAKALGV